MSEEFVPYELPPTYVGGMMARGRTEEVVAQALQFWRANSQQRPTPRQLDLSEEEWAEVGSLITTAIDQAARFQPAPEEGGRGAVRGSTAITSLAPVVAHRSPSPKAQIVGLSPQEILRRRIAELPEIFRAAFPVEFGKQRWAYHAVAWYLGNGRVPQYSSLKRVFPALCLERPEYSALCRWLRPLVSKYQARQVVESAVVDGGVPRTLEVTEMKFGPQGFLFEGLAAVGIPDQMPAWSDRQVGLLVRLFEVRPSSRPTGKTYRDVVWAIIIAHSVPFVGEPCEAAGVLRLAKAFGLRPDTKRSVIASKLARFRSIISGTHGSILRASKPRLLLRPGNQGYQHKFKFDNNNAGSTTEGTSGAAADA